MIKKADIILAVLLIAVGLAASYMLSFGQSAGQELVITAEGERFGSYSLLENQEVQVRRNGHTNKIIIENGEVSMIFSDCPGQDCVHQRAISQTGETIVCLPNKVILEIAGKEKEYDAIAK